jgi:hypothetical protein
MEHTPDSAVEAGPHAMGAFDDGPVPVVEVGMQLSDEPNPPEPQPTSRNAATAGATRI